MKGLPLLRPKGLKHSQVLEDQMSNLNEENIQITIPWMHSFSVGLNFIAIMSVII